MTTTRPMDSFYQFHHNVMAKAYLENKWKFYITQQSDNNTHNLFFWLLHIQKYYKHIKLNMLTLGIKLKFFQLTVIHISSYKQFICKCSIHNFLIIFVYTHLYIKKQDITQNKCREQITYQHSYWCLGNRSARPISIVKPFLLACHRETLSIQIWVDTNLLKDVTKAYQALLIFIIYVGFSRITLNKCK